MAFQIKDFRSIALSMINASRVNQTKVTDYSVGSVVRTLMDASAIEIEELYLQMLLGLQEAVPQAIYQSFGFSRLPAVGASGVVYFTFENGLTTGFVPAGTKIKSPTSTYEYVVLADTFVGQIYPPPSMKVVGAAVACSSTGAATNCSANTLTEIIPPVSGIAGIDNHDAFYNGTDIETDTQQMARFNAFITTLSRGSVAALRYGALMSVLKDAKGNITERVKYCAVEEPYIANNLLPVGWVKVYVHNGVGTTSSQLVAQVKKNIDGYIDTDGTYVPGWKSAGVKVDVLAASDLAVSVAGTVTVLNAEDAATVFASANSQVSTYILSLSNGGTILVSEIISIIMAIDGVYNVSLTTPTSDVTSRVFEKPIPGTITITAA